MFPGLRKGGAVEMNIPSRGLLRVRWLLWLALAAVVVSLPAAQAQEANGRGSTNGLLTHLSQGAAIGYLRAHPDQAPPQFT